MRSEEELLKLQQELEEYLRKKYEKYIDGKMTPEQESDFKYIEGELHVLTWTLKNW